MPGGLLEPWSAIFTCCAGLNEAAALPWFSQSYTAASDDCEKFTGQRHLQRSCISGGGVGGTHFACLRHGARITARIFTLSNCFRSDG